MKNLGVLVSGHGSNLQAILDACAQNVIAGRVACVLSNNAAAFAGERAKKAGVPYHVLPKAPPDERDAVTTRLLNEHNVDVVCLAGYMRLVTSAFVETWWNRLINIHPSLLPSFKGLDTHRRALEAGVQFTGCTVHFVRPEMDEGPIITQAITPVFQNDSEETVKNRVHALEHRCYVQALSWYCADRLVVEGQRVRILSS